MSPTLHMKWHYEHIGNQVFCHPSYGEARNHFDRLSLTLLVNLEKIGGNYVLIDLLNLRSLQHHIYVDQYLLCHIILPPTYV